MRGRSNKKAAKAKAKEFKSRDSRKKPREGGKTKSKSINIKKSKGKQRQISKKTEIPFLSLPKVVLTKLRGVLTEYTKAKKLAEQLIIQDVVEPSSESFITGKVSRIEDLPEEEDLARIDDSDDLEGSVDSQEFSKHADEYDDDDSVDSDDSEFDYSNDSEDFYSSTSTSDYSDDFIIPQAKIMDKFKTKDGIEKIQQLSKQLSSVSISSQPMTTPIVPKFHSIPTKTPEELKTESMALKKSFDQLKLTQAYQTMQSTRQKLPAWELRQQIVQAHLKNRVLIISGETGCGKTTQVPQFLLDAALEEGRGAEYGKIMVTQPRRISAIGVSDRVAKERGETLGKTVGYQIRLESNMSNHTRILYVTTGILLRRLEGSASNSEGIEDFSTIIVDEVHERSLESDFLLMVLKDLLQERPNLRVILMSATLNAELFQEYFGGPEKAPLIHIPGRTFPVKTIYLEDALGMFKMTLDSKQTKPKSKPKTVERNVDELPDEELDFGQLSKRYPNRPKSTIQSLLDLNPEIIQYPLIESACLWMIEQLLPGLFKMIGIKDKKTFAQQQRNPRNQPGQLSTTLTRGDEDLVVDTQAKTRGILIFLPGFAEIQLLYTILSNNPKIKQATKGGKYLLPLHGMLSSEEQVRVFERPSNGFVKIVIATNVAETSITIDDIVYCIDSGRMKENRFDPKKSMTSLEECWISQANGMQRRGRAGRVQPGTCITLYTSHRFNSFLPQQEPEIKRTSLEQICLRIKILPFLHGRIEEVLKKVIEPPSEQSVLQAIDTLCTIQALTRHEHLTPLGWHLGRLPVDVRIGKLIIYGALFKCLDPILTIASTMSTKSPFYAPFDKRDLADYKKMGFARSESDHITLLRCYSQWQYHRSLGAEVERKWCFDNFVSRQTLEMISGVKRQLTELLSDIGFIPPCKAKDIEKLGGFKSDGVALTIGERFSYNGVENLELIKGILVAGLYPNLVKIEKIKFIGGGMSGTKHVKEEYHLMIKDGEEVYVHPTSVNFKLAMMLASGTKTSPFPHPFLIYNEMVKTTKVYLRDCSNISSYALAFFGGGKLKYDEQQQILNMDDGWIKFKALPSVALAIEAVRTALNEVLESKIQDPGIDLKGKGDSLINLIIEIINLQRGPVGK